MWQQQHGGQGQGVGQRQQQVVVLHQGHPRLATVFGSGMLGDNGGVIARIGLQPRDSDIVSVLSARAESVLLLDEIIAEIGSDKPDDWLPIFWRMVKKL